MAGHRVAAARYEPVEWANGAKTPFNGARRCRAWRLQENNAGFRLTVVGEGLPTFYSRIFFWMATQASLQTQTAKGWSACLELGFRPGPGRTQLARRHHQGPLVVQRPFYPEGEVCHVYLLHPPGGIVGGDRLDIQVQTATGSHALITTPGATRLYRSAGPEARVEQHLRLQTGSALEWFPQETIVFPGARARVATTIHLEAGARVAAWEIQCLGRPANRETFETGEVDFRLALWRGQVPLLLERLRVTPRALDGAAGLRGFPVVGTFVVSGTDDAVVDQARAALPAADSDMLGVTRVGDVLVTRYLGHSTQRARKAFTAVWGAVRPSVFGRPACAPRIWAT